jgi:phosphoribosylanthranilate isomerase
MSLWVKICANTTVEDALLAGESGADAVGFVFAPSPRRVTPEQVAAIVPKLPAVLEKIGVFVDSSFDEIAATLEMTGLTGVQLHFDAPPELPAKLRNRFGSELRILRVLHFAEGARFNRYESEAELKGALDPDGYFSDPNVHAILVDSRTATAVGGTGQTFDWSRASKTLFGSAGARRLIAAGGLTPENVAEAIAILSPWGVDVVSGIEAAPGRKDPAKLRAFIANARAAIRHRAGY